MTNYGTVLETGGFLFLYDTDIVLIVDIVKAESPFLESTANPGSSAMGRNRVGLNTRNERLMAYFLQF
jgi:hypothetical protein